MSGTQSDLVNEWNQKWKSGMIQIYEVDKSRPKIQELYDHYIQGQERVKILVPLCGDSKDMKILADKGHEIVGIDCSEMGIKTFLDKHNLEYIQEPCPQVEGSVFKSKNGNYRLYCCDVFKFNVSAEGQFDVILNFGFKGAIQLPHIQVYADLMKSLLKPDGRQLMEFFVYDTEKFPDAPLLYLKHEQIEKIYGDECNVQFLAEGPNPYLELFSKEGHGTPDDYPGESDRESKGLLRIKDLLAAVYYLITWK